MKKFATTALCLALTASMVMPTFGAELKSFRDVPQSHWAHSAIMRAANMGAISGVEAPDANGIGTFAPNQTMTRAQFISIVVRCIGTPVTNNAGDPWYAGAYRSAVQWGLVNASLFPYEGLNQPMTREEMSDVLVAACAFMQEDISEMMPKNLIPDFKKVSSDFETSVRIAYMKGLLVGVDDAGSFDPKGTLTRAAAALVIDRLTDAKVRLVPEIEEEIPAQPVVEEEIKDYWGDEECEEEGWMEEDEMVGVVLPGASPLSPLTKDNIDSILEQLDKNGSVTLDKTENGYVVSTGGTGTKEPASDEIKTGTWVEGEKHTPAKVGDTVIKKDGTKVVLKSTKVGMDNILGYGQGVDFVTGTTINGHTNTEDRLGGAWKGYGNQGAWVKDPQSSEVHLENEWMSIMTNNLPSYNGKKDGETAGLRDGKLKGDYYAWDGLRGTWYWIGPANE